jgi:hypothetical protein
MSDPCSVLHRHLYIAVSITLRMNEMVEECDECGRVYDIFVNMRCPTCSTVAERTADNGYTVTTDSEDGPSAGS